MEQDKVIPLDTQRRLVAYQTAKSWEEVPHVAYLYEPDATEFYQAYLRRREELSGQGLRLTLNTLLLKAVAEGLKAASLLEILPPQVFAVGISALQEKPGVYTDQRGEKAIGVRRYLPMCLAFDHRVMDFSGLVPFLKRMDEIFASPAEIGTW